MTTSADTWWFSALFQPWHRFAADLTMCVGGGKRSVRLSWKIA
jgi:hypothetical protein